MIENWQKKVQVDVEAAQNAIKIIILDSVTQVLHNITQLQRLVMQARRMKTDTWWNEKHCCHKNKFNKNQEQDKLCYRGIMTAKNTIKSKKQLSFQKERKMQNFFNGNKKQLRN